MLDLQKISIGRIRQAYRLKAQEADVLISALARQNHIELYELWHEAERFVAIEENNKKSIYDEVEEAYFPDVSDLKQDLLQQRLATKRLLRYFVSFARGKRSKEYLQRIFDRVLHFTYDTPDQQHIDSANRVIDLIYEQRGFDYHGKDKVDIIWVYVRPELFEKFCNMFDDAVSVNKEAAVIWLFEQGYSHKRDVNGLSRELVKRILATAANVQAQTMPATLPSPTTPKAALMISRSLWDGKTQEYICAALREKGWDNLEIAHVLFHKRGLTQKRAIAKLLHENPNLTDSAYDKYGKMLFEDSKPIAIADEDDI